MILDKLLRLKVFQTCPYDGSIFQEAFAKITDRFKT